MRPSYAVVWRGVEGDRFAGKLELGERTLDLEGSDPEGAPARIRVSYDDLAGVRIGRSPGERMDGRPSLIVELRSGVAVSVAPVGGTGVVFEMGQVLEELVSERAGKAFRATIVAPIKPGMRARVLELIEKGPPFDPGRTSLERHAVYLTEREAVFVFEGPDVQAFAAQLVRSPSAWRAAVAWERCLAGRPRLAEELYAWDPGRGRSEPGGETP